jgi:sn-glycerol 3-phosphate transport system substrate-binding protein
MLDRAGIAVPQTWDDVAAAAKKLRNPEKDIWGIMLPSTNDDYGGWILAALVYANGGRVYNDEYPGEVYYNMPSAIGALTFWRDLVFKHNVMPQGVLNAKSITANFFEQKVAMAMLSTGTLTFIRENVKDFEFGVAMMPEKVRRAVLIGGASLVCYKGISEEQKKAAARFIAFLTSPEIAARWSRVTGYFAPRIKAYEVPAMKDFIARNPNARVGVDQLRYAKSWYATYDTVMVRRAMENRLQKLVNDRNYTPEQCAKEAQEEAAALMEPYVRRTALAVP